MIISMNDLKSKTNRIGRRFAFKVNMKSGNLTREKWVKNRVFKGQLVKDSDGRLFRVKDVKMTEAPPMSMTVLEVKGE